jgi:aspartate-semialdehyde dehydrogenase
MHKTIAIVGASGVVGEKIFNLLKVRGFDQDTIELYAGTTKGRFLVYQGEDYPILPVSDADFSQIDIAFFTAGTEPSVEYAQKAADAGCLVIDNTNVFRMRDDVPLIVPQVNIKHLNGIPESNIIANPNCSTIPLVRAMDTLDQRFGLKEAIVSTYQAVSGAGKAGIEELIDGAKAHLAGKEFTPTTFEAGIAFDVIPRIDDDLTNGSTVEELKMRQESRKILDRPNIKVLATCVRVPVINCHSEAVVLRFEEKVDLDEVIKVLKNTEECVVHTGVGAASDPQPSEVSGSHNLHIGRIRIDDEDSHTLLFWLVSDNLLIGAALNAVQIAEKMRARGWI